MPTLELAWYESLICERAMAPPCDDADAAGPARHQQSAAQLGKRKIALGVGTSATRRSSGGPRSIVSILIRPRR
jgi:hypothetical protein